MARADLGGVTLEYEEVGSGEPVVLIHGAFIADAFRPLVAQPSLANRYRLVTYARRGYAGSSHSGAPVPIADQAADCRALLRHLGIGRAHVVGHSYGGAIALQFVLDWPEAAHSLTLLEPALLVGSSADGYRSSLIEGRERFHEAGAAVAVHEFLQARWPGYGAALEGIVPGAIAQAVADAGTAFEYEIPPLLAWRFGEAEARRISQPALSVLGSESEALSPRFGEAHRMLLSRLPQAEGYVLPGAAHFLQLQNPKDMAEALASFLARHPID